MGLAINGTDILTYPEFSELVDELNDDPTLPAELAAWWHGEPVDASALYAALDVGLRVHATPRGHQLIDHALARVRAVNTPAASS